MTPILLASCALQALLGATSIEGLIVGPDGQPIAHAQVFLEPGLGGVLRDTASTETGAFVFSDVEPGAVGLFAIAPGLGFEGQHLTIAVNDVVPPIKIVLHQAVTVEGILVDPKGEPVAGARVTRIGVKGLHKVGIPLAKLLQYGYSEPASGADGRFVLPQVPDGSLVDLKIGHPSYAQEGVVDIRAGTRDLRVTLHPGVLVEGDVVARANQTAVAQASVLIRNAQPPHDTTTTRSNLTGRFSVRLKPGVYMYQAQGAGLKSPGWERLAITGEKPVEQVRLTVAGTGSIRGNVRDAVSGAPIRDVRVSLTTNGSSAAVARTGPGGDFQFLAGEGENIVRIDATPGYFPPDTQNLKVSILEGNEVELPGMWLKPLPAYTVRVVDGEGHPVPGALVTLLRPRQFGWHVAGSDGTAQLRVQGFPDDGPLLGRVEHPQHPSGALFTIEKSQESPGTVQLFDFSTVEGTVVNARGRGIEGVSVGAFFPGENAADAVLLWQTCTGNNGNFRWAAVVPGVPQRCAARAAAGASGESATFNLAPGENKSLGNLVVEGGESAPSQLGKTLRWYTAPSLCGTLPDKETCAASPVMLVHMKAESVPLYMEQLVQLRDTVNRPELLVVLVADGAPDCEGAPLPVIAGTSPGGAGTLLLDRQGTVVMETNDLPPVQFLRNL